jgi:hypothetical protein
MEVHVKLFTFIALFSISMQSFALEKYNILKGSLHRGGWIDLDSKVIGDSAHINIEYEVKRKRIIPSFVKKYLKGDHVEILPREFLDEDGYLALENSKSLILKNAKIYHLGRVNFGRYTKCHKVKIIANNGKSEMIAYYHPQVGDAGWVHLHLTIKKIPVIKSYDIRANIKETN